MINKYFLPLPGPEILREWDAKTLSDFGIERAADALYRVSITTEDGMTSSLLLHPFSTNAEFDSAETDSRSAGSESSGVSESEVEP